jgi:hypothetical protein
MIPRRPALIVVASLLSALQACGGSRGTNEPTPAPTAPPPDNTPPPDPSPQGNTPPPPDNGAPSATYPAFTPAIGQLVNNGGDVLKTPLFVTVTWPNEANADAFEKFGDMLGESAYWQAIVGEYGVGAASSGAANHVREKTALGASIDSVGLDGLVSKNTTDPTTSGWPAPTDQTIYILYLPAGTSLDLGGGQDACTVGVGGYHDSTQITTADGKTMNVAYAIIPQCQTPNGILDESTMSASHELAEAALDPHPSIGPGWVGYDDAHLAWDYFQQFQDENGDDCEFYKDSFFKNTTDDLPFSIQRQWSNKSAAAGHAPCVPVPSGAYFNTTPLLQENIQVDLSQLQGPSKQTTEGFHIAVNDTKTFQIGFYSDGPTDAWTIEAREGSPFSQAPSTTHRLDLKLDKTSGQNGEKANLTAKVLQAGKTKGELVTIISTQGSKKHFMPILIGSM